MTAKLAAVRYEQGRLTGQIEALGSRLCAEALLKTVTQDVLKSSALAGERLSGEQVRAALAGRLGIYIRERQSVDKEVAGLIEIVADVTGRCAQPLTEERLFAWHAALFPAAYSSRPAIEDGGWRDDRSGPKQIVFVTPGSSPSDFHPIPAEQLGYEMSGFLKWFNSDREAEPVWKAALAHLWFVSVRPFDDGNGRIARAIADLALTRCEAGGQRFYSMSSQIEQEQNDYYEVLAQTQKGTMDVTLWIDWFLDCLGRAIAAAHTSLAAIVTKARFWEKIALLPINERQIQVLNRLLDGYEGKLTSSKWAELARCSQDTALRDITHLVALGILLKATSGGRSTSYSLKEF